VVGTSEKKRTGGGKRHLKPARKEMPSSVRWGRGGQFYRERVSAETPHQGKQILDQGEKRRLTTLIGEKEASEWRGREVHDVTSDMTKRESKSRDHQSRQKKVNSMLAEKRG